MAKGGSYERELCHALSKWWTHGKRDDIFWRTSNSGGRATMRAKSKRTTFGQYGDIHAVDPDGAALNRVCTIEAKRGYNNYTGTSFADVLGKQIGAAQLTFEKFVEQADIESKLAGVPYWLLIQRPDNSRALLIMPRELFNALRKLGALPNLPCPLAMLRVQLAVSDTRTTVRHDLCAMRLEHFFRDVDPECFRKLA